MHRANRALSPALESPNEHMSPSFSNQGIRAPHRADRCPPPVALHRSQLHADGLLADWLLDHDFSEITPQRYLCLAHGSRPQGFAAFLVLSYPMFSRRSLNTVDHRHFSPRSSPSPTLGGPEMASAKNPSCRHSQPPLVLVRSVWREFPCPYQPGSFDQSDRSLAIMNTRPTPNR